MGSLMCAAKGNSSPSVQPRSQGLSEKLSPSSGITLPPSLDALVNGLRAGHGITSPHSPLMKDGATQVLRPIVVCLSHVDGLTTFLTALATLSALREERSGDVILTQSFSLDVGALTSLLEHCQKGGNSDVIRFEISIQAPGQDGIFLNT